MPSGESEFLRSVPLFAALPDSALAELSERARPLALSAGAWLFREGDAAGSLYVVRSGRLEAVAETGGAVLRMLGRGAAIGELGLLTDSARSASVRARRDSELLEIGREAFMGLLDDPAFAAGVLRVLAVQLQASRAIEVSRRPLPATIAVMGLVAGVPLPAAADRLVAELGRHATVARLDDEVASGPAEDWAQALDRREREADHVVLVARNGSGAWWEFCLRQADRVMALAPDGPPTGHQDPRLAGCDLVILSERPWPRWTSAWTEAIDPLAVHNVPGGIARDPVVTAVARRLAGRSVGVVLSGGGARGIAHIGVFEALEAAGLEVDRVGGCSMGAFIGGMYAMGMTPDEIAQHVRAEYVDRNPLNDYTLPVVALLRRAKAEAMMRRTFGERRIEELPREYFCVSADLITSRLHVHRRGLLIEAVGASTCLPAVFPPVARENGMLVDGGVLNNLPADIMAARGEGPIVASDVTARFAPPRAQAAQASSMRRVAARVRSAVVGTSDAAPRLQETLVRSITIGSLDTTEVARRYADLVIAPEVETVGMMAFDQLERIREAGRRATAAALEAAPELVASWR